MYVCCFFSSRRRHTRCALVTGVQTCALPISGRSGVLRLGPKVLAQFGELHPRVLRALDLKAPAVAFEVFLDVIPLPRAGRQKHSLLALSSFQPVSRDFAFLVDEAVPAEKVIRADQKSTRLNSSH